MKRNPEHFRVSEYLLFTLITVAALCLCICVGSVSVPLKDTITVIRNAIARQPQPAGLAVSIILSVRLPRVLCVALSGAALSLSGTCMQGLLKKGQLVTQGSVNAVLCSAQLDPVYGMDVCAWMQTMFSQWSHAPC